MAGVHQYNRSLEIFAANFVIHFRFQQKLIFVSTYWDLVGQYFSGNTGAFVKAMLCRVVAASKTGTCLNNLNSGLVNG